MIPPKEACMLAFDHKSFERLFLTFFKGYQNLTKDFLQVDEAIIYLRVWQHYNGDKPFLEKRKVSSKLFFRPYIINNNKTPIANPTANPATSTTKSSGRKHLPNRHMSPQNRCSYRRSKKQ
jgi:hypothetical protein